MRNQKGTGQALLGSKSFVSNWMSSNQGSVPLAHCSGVNAHTWVHVSLLYGVIGLGPNPPTSLSECTSRWVLPAGSLNDARSWVGCPGPGHHTMAGPLAPAGLHLPGPQPHQHSFGRPGKRGAALGCSEVLPANYSPWGLCKTFI